MKKSLSIFFVLILTITTVSALLGSFYPKEVTSGDINTLVVTMYNHDSSSVRDAQVTMYVPYLGVYEKSKGMKISSRDSARAVIEAEFPNAEPGYYPVIFFVTDEDGIKEKKHTWVYVD